MNTVASLPAKLRWMIADANNLGVNEQTIDLAVLEEAAAALATPAVEGAISAGEAVAFPEVLEGDGGLYVRRERAEGFSAEACRRLNELRLSAMRSGEHITTEDAVSFARSVLSEFTPPPAPAAEQCDIAFLHEMLCTRYGAFPKVLDTDASNITEGLYWAIGEYIEKQRQVTQPEARGVEEAVQRIENALHLCYMDHADNRLTTTLLHDMAVAAAQVATPNPVRAEQPEGRGANWLAERIAKWQETYPDSESSWVNKSDAAVEILEEYGDLICQLAAAPAAPVGVDEAMARRLDDYLGGEFDIRIGKQAAHAALVAAIATTEQAAGGLVRGVG